MMTGHTYYKEMIIKICGIDKKKSTWRWQLKILETDAQSHGHFIETEKKNPGKMLFTFLLFVHMCACLFANIHVYLICMCI